MAVLYAAFLRLNIWFDSSNFGLSFLIYCFRSAKSPHAAMRSLYGTHGTNITFRL